MWARFTVLSDTPIASAIAGCVIPLSRSNTIWMRSRCAAGIFHRSTVFSCRICFLVHLTIRPPESDSQSESYRAIECEPEKDPKPLDSISYGSGITRRTSLVRSGKNGHCGARKIPKAGMWFPVDRNGDCGAALKADQPAHFEYQSALRRKVTCAR